MKNHSYNLHALIYGIFCLHSVAVARYAAFIQAKSPANCDAHLAESIFQTRSKERKKVIRRMAKSQKFSKDSYNIK